MPTALPRRLALATGLLLLLVFLLGPSAGAPAASNKTPSASKALRTLVKQTTKLSRSSVARSRRARLLRLARHARRVAKHKPCTSVKNMASYRKTLNGTKPKPKKKSRRARALRSLATLNASSVAASRSLLASKKTKRCGGGVKPSNLSAPKATLLKSDANGLTVRVQLAQLHFVAASGGGKSFTKLVAPNTDSPGKPGSPAIPVSSHLLGIPDGAKFTVKTTDVKSQTIGGVELFPVQPESVDVDPPKPNFLAPPFKAKPFDISSKAYHHKGFTPGPGGASLGQSRDLNIGGLQVPTARYDPVKKILKVIKSVVLTVGFVGGPHTFSPELSSPWERAQQHLLFGLLNAGIIRTKLPFIRRFCGEEMLVITNSATQAAADQFAVGKRAQGWRTSVFQVGSGAGQIGGTPAAIQAFIRGRLTAPLCIHPSYVTILGDDDLVPTFAGINGIPSDLPYSMKNDADELPDVAVGRLIGNDQTAVGTAVTKILGYETTAPTANGMLNKALVAAQFQDDENDGQENRTFIQFAETVRNGLVGRGVAVDRVYGESPGNNPQRFNDGTSLPASLKKPTFAWNGTGAQVSAGWNDGRFMVVHRDHGWSDGWGLPSFGTGDVNALTNGSKLPVLLSINCSSGAYDYDETSFAGSALVKSDGGAVGVFGDTRDSPSWHNSQIALGFVDALLPSVLPSEGPALKQRTGDALINGKLRLAALAPPAGDGSTRNELYLWHYFGDPSMQMWGGDSPPIVFNPALVSAIYKAKPVTPGDPAPFEVNVTLPKELAGQPISLLQNGQVVGKAFAGDGVATIPADLGDGSVRPGQLEVAFEGDGAQPVKVPVTGAPALPTSLTQSCPESAGVTPGATAVTVTGTLSGGAPAGSTISVIFTPPSGPAQVAQGTTDALGTWSASVIPTRAQLGNWTARAVFGGSGPYGPSEAPSACTFNVFDNG